MASTLGGWYLNGTTLQLRAYKEGTTELSTTVLASINGLTNIKVKGGTGNDKNDVLVKNTSGDWEAIADTDVVVTEETTDFLKKGNGPWEKVGETELVEGADGVSKKTTAKTKFVISSGLLGSSNISVSGSADYAVTMDLNVADKVHIDGTETITYNSSAGTATIIADLTKGFTLNKLDGTATSATYNAAKANQTLATINGLQKNYTASTEQNAVTTVDFKESQRDSDGVVTAGYITLSKVSDVNDAPAGTVSALGTGAITLTNQSIATNNGINYYLKLGGIPGDYVQKNTTDEAAYWTVKGTTATYQYYSPTGYQLTDSSNNIIDNTVANYSTNQTKATKIKVTAAKTTTVVTVTGLAQNLTTNATDSKIAAAKALSTTSGESPLTNTRTLSIADVVGSGQARTGNSASAKFVSGITVTSGPSADSNKPIYKTGTTLDTTAANGGKGTVEINITRSVLPASGTVTVTPGSAFTATVTTDTTEGTNDFYTNDDKNDTTKVKNQRIWVINGNTAIYKEVDLAYYEVQDTTANGVTKIVCKAQTGGTVLATIRGLNEDWLANEDNLTRNSKDTTVGGGVITAIKGITFTKEAGYDYDNNGKPKAKTSEVGEITLSSEVLAGMNVTIGGSDNFKLALLATNGDNTTAVALPKFSNYKWNLNNTTATLKGDVTAGYWAADNGKTINYTAAAKNQTLASVSGLKSGTQLNSNSEGDIRTIGNYTSTTATGKYDTFTEGVTISDSNKLAHKTEIGSKTLIRMPITISKHVLGTSQIGLTSNFFTLKLDKTIDSSATDAEKIASKTYVLEKAEAEAEAATDTIDWHGSLGSTSTLKKSTPAYYTLGDADTAGTVKKITYTKPGTAKTVATVKGLNSAITENDIAFDIEHKTITIKTANALTTSNVTIENPKDATAENKYKLALASGVDALGEAKLSEKTWKQNGTTLSYTAKVIGAGYKLNPDANIITYTKEATSTPTTLATITGIRAGLVTDTAGVKDSSTDNEKKFSDIPGVTFDPKAGTVTLTKAALNNANVKLNGNGNYKLLINTDSNGTAIASDSENYIVTTKPAAKKVWVISGSTATYRLVTPEYYNYDETANSLTYVKPANAQYQNTDENNTETYNKTKTGDIPALGQIKGLKSNLVVSADGQKIGYYDNNGAFQEAITVGTKDTSTGETAIIIKDDYVLDYKNNVTLDNAAIINGYRIYLDTTVADGQTESLADNIKPALDSKAAAPAWTVSNGTATYKGTTKSGYANSSDHKSIIFTQGKSNVEIAKITGLKKTGLTSITGTNDLVFGNGDDANVITVYGNVLTNSDVNLTTSIAVLGKDYKLAIDSTSVSEKSDVDANGKKIWTVSGTTATYGTYKEDYYSLNNANGETSNKITYHAAGVAEGDQLAVITGLASGLIASKVGDADDQIRGITVTSQAAVEADSSADPPVEAQDAKYEILLSSTVLPTSPTATGNNPTVIKLENKNSAAYKLAIDSSVIEPEDANLYEAKNQSNGQTADLTITNITTAGYTLDADKKTLTYNAQTTVGEGLIAKITGLKPNLTKNSNGDIEGIAVDKTNHTITLTKAVLTNSNVELPENENPENSQYTLKLASTGDSYTADQVPTAATSGYGWKKDATTKGKFELRSGMALFGYTLESGGKKIKYTSGDDDGSAVATITGLDKATLTGTEIGGITVSEATESGKKTITITVSTDALSGKDILITPSDTNNTYKLALNGVDASKTTSTWSVNKGTATYKQEFSEGYEVITDKDCKSYTIKYTPKGTITSTLTGLSQENLKVTALETDANGNRANKLYSSVVPTTETPEGATEAITTNTYYGIDFANGVFTVTDSDALAHKNVALTTSVSSGLKKDDYDYKLALGNDKDLKVGTTTTPVLIEATVKDPVWVKSNTTTTATYTQETASGYSLSGNEKNITYSTDPKFVNLATVSNLKKDVTLTSEGKMVTEVKEDGTPKTKVDGIAVTTPQSGTNNGVIKVYTTNLFDGKNVSIANGDKYVFDDDSVEDEPAPKQVWSISGSTATYKNVTPAYYSFAKVNGEDNKKSIVYNKQADYKGADGTEAAKLTEIKGLKSGVKLDSEGYVLDSTGAKTSTQGLKAGSNKVTLSAAVLGTSNVTSDNYALVLDGVLDDPTVATEWVGDGTTYKYKKYTKAYYLLDTANGSKKVTYTAANDIETYATITGLAKDLVDNGKDATEASTSTAIGFSGTVANGGTITLGATQLKGVTGTVKLTSTNGKFKLALNTDTANGGVTESEITPADAWTTSGTTATLKGFKSAGFTLNDSGDTITYQKEGTKGLGSNQTEVTVATVKGLKSGATIDATNDVKDGTGDDKGTKIITLKLAQLGTSNVTLTGDGYKLALDADATSANDEPKWVKATNTTKATYSQNNYNGFTVSADGKTLNYWKSKNNNVDLATINGLAKDVTTDQMGVTNEHNRTTMENMLVVINTADKTITIKKEALGSNNVTLNKNDDYTLQLADTTDGKVGGDTITDQIVYDKNAGKASIVSGTTGIWEEQADGKTLKYTAAKFTTKAELTGLPKTLTYTEATGTKAATLAGISVSSDEITVSSEAVAGFVNNNAITLSNKNYKDDNGANQTAAYKLTLGTGLTAVPSSPDKKEWTLSGTNLTLKELTSAGYTLSNNDTKLTYSAAKTGDELARLTFTGLANGTITKQSDGNIYVGDTTDNSLLAVDNSLTSADSKEITIKSALIGAINNANVATTINLASSKGYSLSSANFTSETSAKPKDPTINQDSFSKTATNGTVTFKRTTPAGWTHTDTKVQYTKAASADAGTISGINKAFTWTTYNGGSTDGLKFTLPDTGETVGTITVGADALTNSNVTFSKVNGGYNYKIVLADNVANDTSWVNKTEWVNNNGAADYKTYDAAHWAQDTDQIKYIGPKNDKSYARISGMSKTASIEDADVSGGVITLHAADLGTSKVTLSINKVSSVSNEALNAEITAGNTKASAFKLALDDDVTLLSSVKDAVWDNNGTVATLTGTIKKGYKLSNDQKSVTYQSADKKLQQIAKVSGIKKDSQITDDNVSLKSVNDNLKVQEITLTPDHLGTSNVQLTGEGYKLALSGDVLIDGEEADNAKWQNQTEWVNNNGTFTYKTYDKIHYKLNDAGTYVQYIAAKDDSSNDEHKTFAQITGLAKDALPTVISAITDTSNNNTVKNGGVISLSDNLLNKATIKLTDTQTSGYTLNMDNVNDSLKSTVSNFNASVSGTGTNIKADWVGTQGKGYFLNNDMQNITYYSAAKTNQTIAKVTGLASTVTSDNNDAFSAAYTASTNVVALGAASLGSSVTVSGTAAFNLGDGDYKDAQIVGSSSADKLTVSGSKLSINAGGGNDIVDLTNASGSIFLYASGNGNDIIKGIGSNTIKITNVAKETKDNKGNVTKTNITVQTDTKNTADTIVKVNTSTIRVKGVPSGVKVFDKDGAEVSYPDPANVLADDNYAMTPQNTSADEDYAMSPNLSSIVKGATSSYTADDLATDDATSLAKQSTAVSYSGKK